MSRELKKLARSMTACFSNADDELLQQICETWAQREANEKKAQTAMKATAAVVKKQLKALTDVQARCATAKKKCDEKEKTLGEANIAATSRAASGTGRTVADLQEELKGLGLPTTGKQADLFARLDEARLDSDESASAPVALASMNVDEAEQPRPQPTTLRQLRAALQVHGLCTEGTKDDLTARLADAELAKLAVVPVTGAETGPEGHKPLQLVSSMELLSFVRALARAPGRWVDASPELHATLQLVRTRSRQQQGSSARTHADIEEQTRKRPREEASAQQQTQASAPNLDSQIAPAVAAKEVRTEAEPSTKKAKSGDIRCCLAVSGLGVLSADAVGRGFRPNAVGRCRRPML